jgi:uncharacterized glyoxalase superfamily protein PhnB
MVEDADLLAAQRHQQDSQEIAAIVADNLLAKMQREGQPLNHASLTTEGVMIMLAAAWAIAKKGPADEQSNRSLYVEFLRRHADKVEALI